MANQARVTSLEVLESFRSELILFLAKAIGSLDEVGDEVRRTRSWVQFDQRLRWEGEMRKRKRVLDQAEQAYLSAKLSALKDNVAMEHQAVLKAKRALAEAEEKMRNVKIWARDFDGRVDPFVKRLSSLRQFLEFDMPKAVTFLLQAQKTLEAYTEIQTPEISGAATTPRSSEELSEPGAPPPL